MTDTIDYQSLDAALMKAIADGRREICELNTAQVKTEALKIRQELRSGSPSARLVQRRLQVLRKAGRISFVRASKENLNAGWTINSSQTAVATRQSKISENLGRVAHDAASKTGGWIRRWQCMSKEEKLQWEAIATAVVDAYESLKPRN